MCLFHMFLNTLFPYIYIYIYIGDTSVRLDILGFGLSKLVVFIMSKFLHRKVGASGQLFNIS